MGLRQEMRKMEKPPESCEKEGLSENMGKSSQAGTKIRVLRRKIHQAEEKENQTGEISQVEENVSQNEGKISKTTISQAEETIAQAGDQINPAGDKINQAGEKINQAGEKMSQAEETIAQAGDKIDQAGEKINQAGEKIGQAEETINQAGEKMNRAQKMSQLAVYLTRPPAALPPSQTYGGTQHVRNSDCDYDYAYLSEECEEDEQEKGKKRETDSDTSLTDKGLIITDKAPVIVDKAPVIVDRAPVIIDNAPVTIDKAPVTTDKAPELMDKAGVTKSPRGPRQKVPPKRPPPPDLSRSLSLTRQPPARCKDPRPQPAHNSERPPLALPTGSKRPPPALPNEATKTPPAAPSARPPPDLPNDSARPPLALPNNSERPPPPLPTQTASPGSPGPQGPKVPPPRPPPPLLRQRPKPPAPDPKALTKALSSRPPPSLPPKSPTETGPWLRAKCRNRAAIEVVGTTPTDLSVPLEPRDSEYEYATAVVAEDGEERNPDYDYADLCQMEAVNARLERLLWRPGQVARPFYPKDEPGEEEEGAEDLKDKVFDDGEDDASTYSYADVWAMSGEQMTLAKALYDNVGETTDELSFRRGDVMTVLEQDPNGLTGWWLCALHGRRGIAPGNRLQIMSSVATTNRNGACGEDTYQSPPNQSEVNWHRRSWHMHPNKRVPMVRHVPTNREKRRTICVVTPQKLGGVYIYDQPNLGYQDYDVPPSRYFRGAAPSPAPAPAPVPAPVLAGSPQLSYDSPLTMKHQVAPHAHQQELYDVPPSTHLPVGGALLTSRSNRCSTSSMRSTGSTATISSSNSSPSLQVGSNPASTCGSARSSTEVQDIYDVPPPTKPVEFSSTPRKLQPGGHSLEFYDTPPKQPAAKVALEDGFSPRKTRLSADSGIETSKIEDAAYDIPLSGGQHQKAEYDIDEIYDTPPSNAPTVCVPRQSRVQGLQVSSGSIEAGSVYDIPPQVTRDSALSFRSDTLSLIDDTSSRLSSCSVTSSGGSSDVPPIPYDELPLDLDSAMELLVKLQQEVYSATSKLLGHVSSSWRQRDNLEPKLYPVKLGCLGVQATLQEFVDFGQGAIANSAKADDKKLVKKLIKLVEPLQDSLTVVVKCMRHLNETNWDITALVQSATDTAHHDELGQIVSQAKEVPNYVRTLASCIQGNSTLLFKRSQKIEGSEMPIQDQEQQQSTMPGKSPPVRPKPPVLPKPKVIPKQVVTLERRVSVQDRPLPPPPAVQELESPTARTEESSGVYEVPHECPPGDDKQNYDHSKEDWMDDYDYVHLENRQVALDRKVSMEASGDEVDGSGDVINADAKSGLSPKFKERLEQLQKDSEQPVITDMSNFVSPDLPTKNGGSHLHNNDKQLLLFYGGQINTHSTLMVNAIDAFFQCVEYNQPPKVFIAHSKYVILAAHKMVYIGDTIHRNLLNDEVRIKVMACANYLCDCLKLTVTSTKNAALQYPNVVTVQEMVDRVVDVSHAANELRVVISQAASL